VTRINSYQAVSYTYVNDGQLSSVSNGTSTNAYAYDALGRCVKRTYNGFVWHYIYDGEKPILEEIDSGWVGGWNVYGKGVDEILERGGGGVDDIWHWVFYNQDAEGSVTHLTDATGAVVEKYKYDAFGVPIIYNGAGAQITQSFYYNRFLFTGREYVETFGIYEYRARAYHPKLGRFTSEDPKLFDGGDYNLFRYCHNDPLDLTDPMGLNPATGADEMLDRRSPERLSATEAQWQRAKEFDRSNAAIAAQSRERMDIEAAGTVIAGRVIANAVAKLHESVQQFRETPLGKSMDEAIEAISMVEGGAAGKAVGASATRIGKVWQQVQEWLGKTGRIITKESGNKIFMNADETKKLRFDLKDPHPHQNPHVHVEEKIDGTWKKSGPIYPSDVPHE
jgi:RHS repeat-associated protein